MTNPIIQTDLAEVLGQINTKLDRLASDVTDLKVSTAEIRGDINRLSAEVKGDIQRLESNILTVKTEIKGDTQRLETETQGNFKTIDTNIATIKADINEIKSSQRAQIWTLIGILFTAVGGFLADRLLLQ